MRSSGTKRSFLGPFPPSQSLLDAFLPLLGHHRTPRPPPVALSHHKRQKCGRAFPSEAVQVPPHPTGLLKGAQSNGNTQRTSMHALGAVEGGRRNSCRPTRAEPVPLPLGLASHAREPLGSSGLFSGFLSSCPHPPPPSPSTTSVSRPLTRPSCTRWPPPW